MDYKNGKIYKIVNDIDDDVYVGSTCQPLSQRMATHRSHTKISKVNNKMCQYMRDVGVEHFRIVLVEDYPCENKEQLRAREEYYRKQLGAGLNTLACHLTDEEKINKRLDSCRQYYKEHKDDILEQKKQYYVQNKDKIEEYRKQHYNNNKDKILEHKKEYYEKNKDKVAEKDRIYYENNRDKLLEQKSQVVNCECGIEITKGSLSRHQKSKKHQKLMTSNN